MLFCVLIIPTALYQTIQIGDNKYNTVVILLCLPSRFWHGSFISGSEAINFNGNGGFTMTSYLTWCNLILCSKYNKAIFENAHSVVLHFDFPTSPY